MAESFRESPKQGVHRVAALDVSSIRADATGAGFATFVLPAQSIVDSESFFAAARETFPLNPPVTSSGNWNGLSDSLWQSLYEHESSRIVVLWPGAREMQVGAPSDFEIAVAVLSDAATTLADPKATVGRPKVVAVLIEQD